MMDRRCEGQRWRRWGLLRSLLFVIAQRTVNGAGIGNFFTYFEEGGLGPSRWKFLQVDDNQCGGTQGASHYGQSPVEISRAVQLGTCDTDLSAYDFVAGDCQWGQLDFTLSNNGVKVAPKAGTACSFGKMNIPQTPNQFEALQFHIHTHSEHRIVGQGESGFYPAELHIVHQEVTKESFAVLGTMIAVGDQPHAQFEWFLQGWEQTATAVAAACPNQESVASPVQELVTCGDINVFPTPRTTVAFPATEAPNLYNLPTASDWGTFTYKGGLTTPSCTEIVNWNLLDKPMEIGQGQLERLQRLVLCFVATNDNGQCSYATVADKLGSTSRPPQPLSGRTVLHRCRNGPHVTVDDIGTLPPDTGDEPFVKPPRVIEPSNVKSSKCTKALYQDCSHDKRYDPRVSLNLKANADVWYDAEGYWIGTIRAYDSRGAPLMEVFASERFQNTLPYPRDEYLVFLNRTIVSTRYYEHAYFVYRPSDTNTSNFCAAVIPQESANVLGDGGVCGVHGYADIGEKFGTATHEKDGSVQLLMATGRFAGADRGRVVPIDENTFYTAVGSPEFEYSETESFSDTYHTHINANGQYFIKSSFPPYSVHPLAESNTMEVQQVSESKFRAKLEQAYFDNNVRPADRKPFIAAGNCIDVNACPTEEQFRSQDPLFTKSPYEEDARIKGGWIAFFVLIGASVLALMLFAWHHHLVVQQEERFKHQFANRVASTIQMEGTHEKLTAEALEDEFARMDKDHDGFLTKTELREFMDDRLNERDFEVMYAAIDLDHNGTIDFTEFCAFLASMGAIYDEEEKKVHFHDTDPEFLGCQIVL